MMNKTIKVIMCIIIVIAMLFGAVPTVFAEGETNFSVILTANKTKVNHGGTVEVTIGLGEFSNIGEGINSFLGDLEFDKTKLSIESGDVVAQNGWDTPTYENDKLLTTKGSMITANEEIIKITFTVNDNAALGATTITLKNVEAANDENDFVGVEGTVSIEITEESTGDDGSSDDGSGDDGLGDDGSGDDGAGDGGASDDGAGNGGTGDDGKEEQPTTEGTTVVVGGDKKDNTTANKEIPKAGLNTMLVIGIVAIVIVAVVMYRKNRKYEDIR